MALDINKIIHDSINEIKVDDTEDGNVEYFAETDQFIDHTTEDNNTTNNDANQMSIASAISAGLGAITLRNHLRSLNES